MNKKAFDPEYMTQWKREADFLLQKNIHPVYIRSSRYGIPEYKYTKTPELFTALTEFFGQEDIVSKISKFAKGGSEC